MTFNRRRFLQKIILASGAVAFQDIALGKSLLSSKGHSNQIFHVGSEAISKNSFLLGPKALSIVTDSSFNIDPNLPDAVLFDSTYMNQYRSGIDLTKKTTRFVNSNFEGGKPENVSEYLITEKTGIKIGILGVGLLGTSTTLSKTIALLNSKASFLKDDLNCDQVYCLVETLNSENSIFTISELVENSEFIDHFYTSNAEKKKHQLRALPNVVGKQIFLSYQSLSDTDHALIELKNGNLSSYRIVC